ncbi:hypothetical protein AKJ66_03955 [candidate division MSBL1 archaeon SCGC-AAA259E22]|uniref:HTH tetR-type domain-containing protein n=1 Tax=candidate division MSBL1 archaeon SCGC-AAA259E22 TaxID=1698265 RepID=A0A133UEC6_9EURY|nr:hypothetical protein AKJ66_03955 [candidate division MSBL1 archaeon SCGC-AAA259E22]
MGRKKSETRKREIVQSSLNLIAERGIRNLTTARIAERVGFSEAALYKHFQSKEKVIAAAIDEAGRRLLEALKKAVEGEKGMTSLQKVFKAHLVFVENNPGVARLLFSDEIHFERENLRAKLLRVTERVQNFVKDLLKSGIEMGEIREDLDLEAAAVFYLGVFQSQVLLWSLSGGTKSLTEEFDRLWSFYCELIEK